MKLSYVPDGYPDEVLYSMVARYAAHLRLPSYTAVAATWFGTTAPTIIIDLPTHLDAVLRAFPTPHAYTIERLIEQHTLYPFYAPFLPSARAEALRAGMRTVRVGLHWIAGLATCNIPKLHWLRSCPACVAQDRYDYGETYWHRGHQISGVNVCPVHAFWLEDSQVNIHLGNRQQDRKRYEWFVTAEQALGTILPAASTAPIPPLLNALAGDAYWLLTHQLNHDRDWLHAQYRTILRQQGFLTSHGWVRHQALMQAVAERIPAEVLTHLHCDMHDTDDNWLMRALDVRQGHAQHPLYHLLLLRMLGQPLATLRVAVCHPYRPFGEGPWPCLNPLCPRYRHRCITTYRERSGQKQPIATFTCRCGYAYSRTGPDTCLDDHFRSGRIADYGDLWRQCLRRLWNDAHLSLADIALQMHTTVTTLCRQAALLDLPFAPDAPQRGKRPATPYQDATAARREPYRQTWLQVQAACPDAWLSQLIQQEQAVYRWLERHDRVWLSEHRPTEPEREQRRDQARREQMHAMHVRQAQQHDADLAQGIRGAAQRLRASPDMPIQLTCAAISREMGHIALWNVAHLPLHLTQARHALAEAAESYETFVMRKLAWVVQRYQEEQACPSQRDFFRRVGLYWKVLQDGAIRQLAETTYAHHFGMGWQGSGGMPGEE